MAQNIFDDIESLYKIEQNLQHSEKAFEEAKRQLEELEKNVAPQITFQQAADFVQKKKSMRENIRNLDNEIKNQIKESKLLEREFLENYPKDVWISTYNTPGAGFKCEFKINSNPIKYDCLYISFKKKE